MAAGRGSGADVAAFRHETVERIEALLGGVVSIPDWGLTLVDTQADVETFLQWIDDLEGMISIDTETTGLKWWTPAFLRLVTFADDHQGFAVPVEWWGRPLHNALARVREKGVPVCFWNQKFDRHALESSGYAVPEPHNVHDGFVMHHLLTPHKGHALKPSAVETLGAYAGVGQNLLKQHFRTTKTGWADVAVDTPVYWQYGILDTLITQAMVRKLGPQLGPAGLLPAYEREMQVQDVMGRAESRGLRVDSTHAKQVRSAWLTEAVGLQADLKAHGLENPNSNRQLQAVFERQGWCPNEFTDTGQALLDKAVLRALSVDFPDIAPQILRYRRITKWISTYLDVFAASDIVHPSINTMAAVTGRMSITNPPLQTLPSKGSDGVIRKCILPYPGQDLWSIDYQGQEARIFANLSKDPGMAQAYAGGNDLYTHVARTVWQDQTIEKSDPRRGVAKVILLAFTYGAGPDKLATASGLPKPEVVRFLKQLFTMFPHVRDLTGDHAVGGSFPGQPALDAGAQFEASGLRFVTTSGGRRFSVPDDDSLYKCVNGLCQGSGKDVLSKAIVRLDRAGFGDSIVVPVHDEILFSFPKGDTDSPKECAILMTDSEWDIPLTVDVEGPLKHWGQNYEEETDA